MRKISLGVDTRGAESWEVLSMSGLRRMAVPIGVVAAVLLVLLFNPWVVIEEGSTVRAVLTVAFWVAFLLLLVALFEDRRDPDAGEVEVEGRRFARFLFNNTRAGLFWLPIRLFLGFASACAALVHQWTIGRRSTATSSRSALQTTPSARFPLSPS